MIINAFPTSDKDTGWSVNTGNRWEALRSDDGDTTYIFTAVAATQSLYSVELPSDAAVINDVKRSSKAKLTTAGSEPLRLAIANASGNSYTEVAVNTTGYVLYTSLSLSRPGGGNWTSADFIGGTTTWYMEWLVGAPTHTVRVSYGYITVDFIPGGGGFAFLIGSLLAGALGANLMMSDMPKIAQDVTRLDRVHRRITVIQPHEYERVLRELKEDPHRRYF